ncbi:hypothetical protein TBLA_0B04770 [Henningerozyma blattae CBS 6284]|uniref:Uncharacterized protein n=1 Tax=Henningerozyma blattae (strain ATCC 34711 / CBS 6284 / DSM 70876 / NBRC 10599 / NRRL Y-10934 / UCD 77-7) TaxID=1071380 RepID=I2GYW0_HENB6|nr:hypothetical protein TBLA_0B04770 [Tetrapisispora blattae CBS 6284]CCH59312.1 hypothetical protein TBLA_0B04770 [Tetrapisispora blattae CBS 6284]
MVNKKLNKEFSYYTDTDYTNFSDTDLSLKTESSSRLLQLSSNTKAKSKYSCNYSKPNKLFSKLRKYNQKFTHMIHSRLHIRETKLSKSIIFSVFVFIIFLITNHYSSKEYKISYSYYSPVLFYKQYSVDRIKGLLDLDLSSKFNSISYIENLPINSKIIDDKYQTFRFKGYTPNMRFDQLKMLENNKNTNNKDIVKFDNHIDEGTLVKASCEDLEHNGEVQYSKERTILKDDLIAVRKNILTKDDFITNIIKNHEDSEKDMKVEDIIRKKWFKFGTSSVWLEKEQCYLAISRILYSSEGIKTKPVVSVLRAQTFDKNWKEIIGKRIPRVDVDLPQNLEVELEKVDREFGISFSCEHLKGNPTAYDKCLVKQANGYLKDSQRRDKLLDRYFVTYPTIFRFPFKSDGNFLGAEDPHIVLREKNGVEEPIVVFNMDNGHGRRMHAYLPHRSFDQMIEFKFNDEEMKSTEKGWAPFYKREYNEESISSLSRGSIHFIYNFQPLEILKCSLNDGLCEKIFQTQSLGLESGSLLKDVTGGTQFRSLPSSLPLIENKNIWVGFSKYKATDCKCGHSFYRPMLQVLLESNGVFYMDLFSPSMDFDSDILSWDEKNFNCGGINQMAPNSIASWEILKQDVATQKYYDYMTFTYSESDTLSKAMVIKGLLNYILKTYTEKGIDEEYSINSHTDYIMGSALKCVEAQAHDRCTEYLQLHS